jgi:uncharacterized Zn finger protein
MEKRKCSRKECKGDVSGRIIFIEFLDIIDLSLSGIRFNCYRRVNMNSVHMIKIEKGKVSAKLKGVVVRSILKRMGVNDKKSLPLYEVALKFEKLSDSEKKSLEKVIQLLGNE